MPESEENEFASFSLFSPSRAPLNSIPDPSRLQKTTTTTHLSGFEGRGAGGAHDSNPRNENEVEKEFEDCRKMNSSLVRELDEIRAGLGTYLKFDQIQSDFVASSTIGAEQVNQAHEHSTEEMIALESEEDQSMKDTITARETEIRAVNQDWDKATLEPTNLIVGGSKSIKDASTLIESIVCSFPHVKRKNPTTKMTSRLPFFFSLFLFTATTLTPTASGATSCRTSCGSIQINYPFGIDKGCGSPQFNGMLNCSSTDLFFFTPSGGYKVRSIDYDKSTMVVFDPLMSTCSILQPHHDFKLSDIQNALIRPSYDTVFALFNCSSVSPVQNRYKSLCFSAAGHSCDELYSSCTSFRIFNTTSPYGNTNSTVHATPYCCFTSYDTVRVMSMNILDCSHYTTVIDDGKMKGVAPIDWSYGIQLSYSAPEIGCSRCRKSGGTCGYDDETEIFLCQCSNNISPRDCGGVSDQGGCNSTKANYAAIFLVMLVSFICAIL